MKNSTMEMAGTVKVTKTIAAIDVLGQLSWVLRNLIKAFYTNPWQLYQQADVDMQITYQGQTIPLKTQGMVLAEFY